MWVKIVIFGGGAQIRVIGCGKPRSNWYGDVIRSDPWKPWVGFAGFGFVAYNLVGRFVGMAWIRRCSEEVGHAGTDAKAADCGRMLARERHTLSITCSLLRNADDHAPLGRARAAR
jgi:hypothetical protein